ncbi:uncharacterized protein LOC116228219 [Phasianus colchicus]|uniref:uncharacterized protein LOC116228219 n=1 Tax=Phasianus colchicus TaxID=9054 RepID=UPI00129ED9DD|nr:uncharacterized protein LOC116228219 [Phasianus colchicus]
MSAWNMKTIPAGLTALRPPSPRCMLRCLTPAQALRDTAAVPRVSGIEMGRGRTSIAHSSGAVGCTGPGPPPLPPPASWFQQVAWKMSERSVPHQHHATAHIRHWRRRAAICLYMAKQGAAFSPRPCARPVASLRLFEVSLHALFCLPLAARFTRQFLVDSPPTAALPVRRWAWGRVLLWHCGQPITPGVSTALGTAAVCPLVPLEGWGLSPPGSYPLPQIVGREQSAGGTEPAGQSWGSQPISVCPGLSWLSPLGSEVLQFCLVPSQQSSWPAGGLQPLLCSPSTFPKASFGLRDAVQPGL